MHQEPHPSPALNLAFVLFKYFPFGGLQRDCLRISQIAAARGHKVTVWTRSWEGPKPEALEIQIVPVTGLSNVQKDRSFIRNVREALRRRQPDGIVGFNRLPFLDVYFCADVCYRARFGEKAPLIRRVLPRYRHFVAMEAGVFASPTPPEILMLTPREIPLYQRFYGNRPTFHVLPPGIDRVESTPEQRLKERASVREELGLELPDRIALFVGSGFRTKGLDRAVRAIAAHRGKVHLVVVGKDNPAPYRRVAVQGGVASFVHFLGGRSDVKRFYLAADFLIHPAVAENTGTVLLEAAVAGLPVLTTAACGYAFHIEKAGAGIVLPQPFSQSALNEALGRMFDPESQTRWRTRGLAYAASEDLYSLHQRAAELIEKIVARRRHSPSPHAGG